MRKFGLIGHPLSHSFSQSYFTKKFIDEKIVDAEYKNYPLTDIGEFPALIDDYGEFVGFNVTIPYKEQIIPFLDELDKVARDVEAVNTVKIEQTENGRTILKGYNTDVYGFEETIRSYIQQNHRKALILGTGGASKAIEYVFKKHAIHCEYISRKSSEGIYKTYDDLKADDLQDFHIIVNTTPLGMFPETEEFPPIPYEGITSDHVLYDLIYNPQETIFLAKGRALGAITINGLAMLHKQAEKAWTIWNR